jgi:hypothetical protein
MASIIKDVEIDARPDDVWAAVVDSSLGFTHNNASAQVFTEDEDQTRFVRITDLLPDDLATRAVELMDYGIAVIKQTMESKASHQRPPSKGTTRQRFWVDA